MSPIPKWIEILTYWIENDHLIPDFVYVDWEKPSCWGCNQTFHVNNNQKRGEKSLKSLAKLWEKSPLERAHITPRSLTGEDVSRIVPLCKWCHIKSPDVDDPRFFWAWASVQNYEIARDKEVMSCLTVFGLNKSQDLNDCMKLEVGDENMKAFLDDHGGQHFDRFFGAFVSRSTIAACMVMYLETLTGKRYAPDVKAYLLRQPAKKRSQSECNLLKIGNLEKAERMAMKSGTFSGPSGR